MLTKGNRIKQDIATKRRSLAINQGFAFLNKLDRSIGVEYDYDYPQAPQVFNFPNIISFSRDDHPELRTVPAKSDALLATLLLVKEIARKSTPPNYENWGLHTHVDALDLSRADLIRFIYMYQYIEEVVQQQIVHPQRQAKPYSKLLNPLPPLSDLTNTGLTAFCGKDKEPTKRLLCHIVSTKGTAPQQCYLWKLLFSNDPIVSWWPEHFGRFSIGLFQLASFGTIEFRIKEAVAGTDPVDDVVFWPLFCGWLVETAKRSNDREIVKWLPPDFTSFGAKKHHTFLFLSQFIPEPIFNWFDKHTYAPSLFSL